MGDVHYVLVGASAVSILPVLFVKEDYNRAQEQPPDTSLQHHTCLKATPTPATPPRLSYPRPTSRRNVAPLLVPRITTLR
ncbi:hypothetical protein Pcinc_014336 [Petrolisthes cinctipes]|uniref:Uncharacterized protein n=1 Tax=Petrolisthes cinctipes TaxID=88211 RepID=A0AAE1FY04_PETCI|nr:hypothetical protein Pcinc_014336 [Petrolisthes cinctipes]